MFHLTSAALSECSSSRDNNEDAIYSDNKLGFFAIADGMGGHPKGEEASQLALRALVTEYSRLASGSLSAATLAKMIDAANIALWSKNAQLPLAMRMGTTLSFVLLQPTKLAFGHVGDTRIYLIDDRLTLLTTDHNGHQMPHARNSVLEQAIGISSAVRPQVKIIEIEPPYQAVLCSDGFYAFLPPQELSEIAHIYKTPKARIDEARNRLMLQNPDDNFSAIFVQAHP